jgi:hypothetical protein
MTPAEAPEAVTAKLREPVTVYVTAEGAGGAAAAASEEGAV